MIASTASAVDATAGYEQEESYLFYLSQRWDSVSFYSRRGDVESYSAQEQGKLIHDLKTHGNAIVFLRRDEYFQQVLKALPAEMEIEFVGRKSDYVAVGFVRPRTK